MVDTFGHTIFSDAQLLFGDDENQNGVFNYFYTSRAVGTTRQVSLRDDNIWWSPEAHTRSNTDGLALVRTVQVVQASEPSAIALFVLTLVLLISSKRNRLF